MTAQTKQEELKQRLLTHMNGLYPESKQSIEELDNEENKMLDVLIAFINSEVLSALEELEGEAVENVNGVKVIGIHHLESIKNRYKEL